MKDEMWAMIRKMKSGPFSTSVELLEALEDFGTDKTATLFKL